MVLGAEKRPDMRRMLGIMVWDVHLASWGLALEMIVLREL